MSREQEFQAKFAALFEFLPDAVFLLAHGGKIEDCNTAAAGMTGRPKADVPGLMMTDILGDDISGLISALENSDNDSCTVSGSMRGSGGSVIPVEIGMRSFRIAENTHIFVIVRDRSEQCQREEITALLSRRLRQSEKMGVIGQFAGGMNHYYSNIFTGILSALDIAKRDAPAEILPLLRRAEKVANTASGFSRRLLCFTRESEDAREPVDIGTLLDDVLEFARSTFDKGIAIEFRKPENLDAVLADTAGVHHMLLNLLVNSRDALTEKAESVSWGPKLAVIVTADNVTVDTAYARIHHNAKPGRYVRVTVTDTGCGMDEDTMKRAFEPYFTTKAAGRGTGLGLASAVSTVDEAGGWIECESECGTGTTITVFLPALTLRKTVSRDIAPAELPRGTETVLLVDDDEMIRSLGTMTLERQGYTVFSAGDGRKGLDLFTWNRHAVDIVVLDLLLPVLSGEQMLERIRRIEPEIPVIVTSGHDFERDKKLYSKLRADDYILKPFNIADLILSVSNILDRKKRGIS